MSDMAFPSFQKLEIFDDGYGEYVDSWLPVGGMLLRDYFAAKAMQSYMAWALGQPINDEADSRKKAAEKYARVGYEIADAMLKAREQQS